MRQGGGSEAAGAEIRREAPLSSTRRRPTLHCIGLFLPRIIMAPPPCRTEPTVSSHAALLCALF
jgi:hypothetical protein